MRRPASLHPPGDFSRALVDHNISDTSAGSRYKIAAEAFDDHIAHLIRPVLGYFKPDSKEDPKFDGIGFSTTIRLAGKTQATQGSEAVEFFLPLAALRSYERYDCTGQQMIGAGIILINGERVSLNLQIAEGNRTPKRGFATQTRISAERALSDSFPAATSKLIHRIGSHTNPHAHRLGIPEACHPRREYGVETARHSGAALVLAGIRKYQRRNQRLLCS